MNLKTIKKLLKKGFSKTGGRNNQGKITNFHKGGGHKQQYRKIDFKQNNYEGKVISIEYDPIRSANIALIYDLTNKIYKYILAPDSLEIGTILNFNIKSILKNKTDENQLQMNKVYKIPGNRLMLKDIPIGSKIYNIELLPNKGGQLVRSAGTTASILQIQSKYAKIKLPSNEERLILNTCLASIGQVSNKFHNKVNIKKAGRNRWLNKRPTVRGVAMNPVDHPHGGGEGKTSGGRHPVTPWGKLTKGKKTVLKKNKLILKKSYKKN